MGNKKEKSKNYKAEPIKEVKAPVEKPIEKPVEKPVEKPTTKPVVTPPKTKPKKGNVSKNRGYGIGVPK